MAHEQNVIFRMMLIGLEAGTFPSGLCLDAYRDWRIRL